MLIHSAQHDIRDEAVDAARAAGKMGATRLPDSVLFTRGREISDTTVVRCLNALEAGHAERELAQSAPVPPPTYLQWLGENHERLTQACLESGCEDGGKWLRQQYTLETGLTP